MVEKNDSTLAALGLANNNFRGEKKSISRSAEAVLQLYSQYHKYVCGCIMSADGEF